MDEYPYDLPNPDEISQEDINEYYCGKCGGMDTEKGDKDGDISPEEMDNIDRFLREFDEKNFPPNGPEDFI